MTATRPQPTLVAVRCTILDDYQSAALRSADWSPLAGRVSVTALSSHLEGEDAIAEALADSEIVVVMRERTPLTATLLARLPKLRLIVTSGMRNASIDVAAARARGIVVSGTPSASEPPAELTWALLLALARRLPTELAAMRSGGPWQSTVGADLHGRTLGLVGLGKIGSKVARVGAAFGMDVVGWSPNLTAERAAAAGVRFAPSLAVLLGESDFVSLHLVLSASTRGIVGAGELAAMRPTAFLVNTSRSGLVDSAALLAALDAGRIAGAGLDVFDEEPLAAAHPLRAHPRVVATPHLGYVTEANYRAYFEGAVEDIQAWLDGQPIRLLGSAA